MAGFGSIHPTQPAGAIAVTEPEWQTLWLDAQARRRESDSMTTSYSSDSESNYIGTPQGSAPTSPRTPSLWNKASESGKRKLNRYDEDLHPAATLPSVSLFLNWSEGTQQMLPLRPKRRQLSPLSSPESSHRQLSIPDDPITRSLNRGRRPEKGLLSRPTGLGDAQIRFGPMRNTHALHDAQSARSYPYQQLSSPREEARRERAKPKGTHCNVKYLPEEMDFIRYHKIDLKETWHEVRQNFSSFQKRFSKEQLSRQVQGLQGVHYRENYTIPSPRKETNGRRLNYLANGHVEARPCKVREQGEYKYQYGLVYLFPERAKDYSWVRPDHRRFATELSAERLQEKAQAKREAMERGTWIEKVEDNSCMCCEHEDHDVSPGGSRHMDQMYESHYVDIPYDPRL